MKLLTPSRKLTWQSATPEVAEELTDREWLVANGLGGYACGSIAGIPTRRFHALLVAALPAPIGRATLLNRLTESIRLPNNENLYLGGEESDDGLKLYDGGALNEFRLEAGLPVWRYRVGAFVIEKRVLIIHMQNTVHITYSVVEGEGTLRLKSRPWVNFRPHEGSVAGPRGPYRVVSVGEQHELQGEPNYPPLRVKIVGDNHSYTLLGEKAQLRYRVEESRGYDHSGSLISPGFFRANLTKGAPVTLIASCESWETIGAISPEEAVEAEQQRRRRLLAQAHPAAQGGIAAELVLAADQFVITPATRAQEAARAHASGDEVRTVIAGYHWFTDWGRDTMISFEGLLLQTGRYHEARYVLHTFAQYTRDGLIPNLFPERSNEGLYHTADATLWLFHAVDRFVHCTGERHTLRDLLPVLQDIVAWHLRGTHFGIGVDPSDGLLRQGAPGYQLTWMDAKCDGWVVTPRRGKAVEINALWYNALCNLARWLEEESQPTAAVAIAHHARRVEEAFNQRFFCADKGHLYDVVDTESGTDDASLRPNQIFAISLPNPVLRREHW
ncbi:MAG: hypothetical protein RLZZ450_1597, partial [Pseudomonadota bacterium]